MLAVDLDSILRVVRIGKQCLQPLITPQTQRSLMDDAISVPAVVSVAAL